MKTIKIPESVAQVLGLTNKILAFTKNEKSVFKSLSEEKWIKFPKPADLTKEDRSLKNGVKALLKKKYITVNKKGYFTLMPLGKKEMKKQGLKIAK